MLALALAWVGTLCWVACFIWMHHVSKRQEALLAELRAIAKGIEATSQAGHELIKQVHPAVDEIKESVQDMANAVSEK